MRRPLAVLLCPLLLLLMFPTIVLAADAGTGEPPLPVTQVLPATQLWAALAGSLVPLLTYVINRHVASETASAAIVVVVSALAGAAAQLLDTGQFALDVATLQVLATAVASALAAHAWLWKPSGVASRLRRRPVAEPPV